MLVQNSSFPEEDTPVYIPAANPDVFLAERIAHFLCKAFSIGADGLYKDFVVVCSSGQPAAPVAFWGIIVAGGVLRAASHSLTPEELARQMKQGKTNVTIGATWGVSETTDPVTAMPRGSSAATDSISPVMPNMEPRIVDYCDIKPGQPGKTMVRGPFVTNGWDGHPEATQSTFRNGSFLTGDMAIETRGKLSTLSIGRRN
ncbi:4-coumarate ligase [Paraphaeosphaeria sporulosa]